MVRKFFLSLTIVLFLSSLSWAWQGKVVGISDGDTITVLHNNRGEKIRLYGIDTPEKHQDFGNRAKQFTSDMVFGKFVEVEPVTKDRYNRTVGLVLTANVLTKSLFVQGLHGYISKYCNKAVCNDWLNLEATAKANRVGLWSHPNPTPPWMFRHGKSRRSQTDFTNLVDTQGIVYHGNVKSKVFHTPGCRHYNCMNCNAVFNSRNEAIGLGYRPCKFCQP